MAFPKLVQFFSQTSIILSCFSSSAIAFMSLTRAACGVTLIYFGQHLDPRVKEQKPELVAKAIVPDLPLGSHTASLGLIFYTGANFPSKYHGGAFVGQHGSWNRSPLGGYKVVFAPFSGGKPSGDPEDFLTGFMTGAGGNEVYGRPVGVAVAHDGSLLVTDDAGNIIWRVSNQY